MINKDHVSSTNTSSKEKSSKERKLKQETKETSTDQSTRNRKEKPSIFVIEYNMTKKLNGYLLTKKIKHKVIVKVRPFTTAKVSCMQDHVKPTIRDINPQNEKAELKTERRASQIAKSIIDLCIPLKKNENTIGFSGIIPRLDELNNKATEVNNHLQLMFKQRGIHLYPTVKP